jgi:glutathione S-transferase
MLKIYGWKRSRAMRCMWVMEELGLQYEQVPLNPQAGETRTAEHLALNPSGKIPTLVHDGFVLTESMAISFYLAGAFPGTLLPREPQALAKVYQWTSWALTEFEPTLAAILREGRRPQEQIDAARIQASRAEVNGLLAKILEPHLARNEYLLAGEAFTLADLLAAAVISPARMFEISFAEHPHTERWLERCLSREAYRRAQGRQ